MSALAGDRALSALAQPRQQALFSGLLAVDGGEQLAGDDHVVWLCDPLTGTIVGELSGHPYWVEDMAAVPLPGGATLLAVGSVSNAEQPGPPDSEEYPDEVRLWNPLTATEVGDPIPDCTAPLAAVPMPDDRTLLATGVVGRHLRLWDPATGTPVGKPLPGHTGWLTAMTTVELPGGRTLLGELQHRRHHTTVGSRRRSSRARPAYRARPTGTRAGGDTPPRRRIPARLRRQRRHRTTMGPHHRGVPARPTAGLAGPFTRRTGTAARGRLRPRRPTTSTFTPAPSNALAGPIGQIDAHGPMPAIHSASIAIPEH